MATIQLTARQREIILMLKEHGSITGEGIAQHLNLSRAAIRADLTILVMAGLIDAKPRVGYYYVGDNCRTVISEKIMEMKVSDYKSIPIVVKEESSVYDTIVRMFIEDVGSLFIVSEGGILQGVVSRKDLLKVTLGQGDIRNMPVNVVMTRMPNIITTSLEESIFDAAKKIMEHQVDALPVVRPCEAEGPNKGKLEVVGRFTKTNITRIFLELVEGV
ncbi:MAG: helix-turn-helix transcriptional regulator [Dehalobacterium sp.]